MNGPILPVSAKALSKRLLDLRDHRALRHGARKAAPVSRQALSKRERAVVLAKTDGRCHICGGDVGEKWNADHVRSHNDGGAHRADNYLAAHGLCNNYRWDYSSEEFQWILKIGVWARSQMQVNSGFGSKILERFYKYDLRRESRRSKK